MTIVAWIVEATWPACVDAAHATLSTMWNTNAWGHELEIIGSRATLRWRPADTGKVTKIVAELVL